ncbi:hypothetical protein GCM10010176_043670 [Nonomuraea spiralis]|nr:hypothetical protein GCM10010176_043670 [Nonomuraea spiralis]
MRRAEALGALLLPALLGVLVLLLPTLLLLLLSVLVLLRPALLLPILLGLPAVRGAVGGLLSVRGLGVVSRLLPVRSLLARLRDLLAVGLLVRLLRRVRLLRLLRLLPASSVRRGALRILARWGIIRRHHSTHNVDF